MGFFFFFKKGGVVLFFFTELGICVFFKKVGWFFF